MELNKQKLSENPILIAVSLLEAASLCHDASIAVQEVISIVKSRFPSTLILLPLLISKNAWHQN